MPTIDENRRHWGATYDWADRGEEWSEVWGGSAAQWTGSILPRIGGLVPAGRVLEIGCGHGRWSRYLRPFCRELVLVDLAESCVDACRELFRSDPAVDCRVTDGRTLPGVAGGSLDFVFSFDSLVHAEQDALDGYVSALAGALSAEGAAFLHHSNFGAVLAERPGSENRHWRGESVSADSVAAAARAAGLVCPLQEIVDWGGVEDCDVFTLLARPGSSRDREPLRLRNPFFMGEAQSLALRSRVWGLGREAASGPERRGWWSRLLGGD